MVNPLPPGTPGRGRGRPTEFTPALRDRLLQLVAEGASIGAAAAAVGTSRPTVHRHRHADPHFHQALARAQQEAAAVRREQRVARGRDIDRCGTQARYIKAKCRCPQCTAAGTKGRYARREAAAEPALAEQAGVVPASPLPREEREVGRVLRRAG